MIDNEAIDKFVQETLAEIKELDQQLEAAKAAAAPYQNMALSAAEQREAEALLAQAKAQAEEAGRLRQSSSYINIMQDKPKAASGMSRRRRTLI